VEVSGLQKIFSDIVSVIRAISEDEWPFRNMENEERNALKDAISNLEGLFKRIPA
jgi:hypothetical protein